MFAMRAAAFMSSTLVKMCLGRDSRRTEPARADSRDHDVAPQLTRGGSHQGCALKKKLTRGSGRKRRLVVTALAALDLRRVAIFLCCSDQPCNS